MTPKHEERKRLPGPVKYEVEKLPHKITLDISTSKELSQALVGDPFTIDFKINQKPDILLKTLKVKIIDI